MSRRKDEQVISGKDEHLIGGKDEQVIQEKRERGEVCGKIEN